MKQFHTVSAVVCFLGACGLAGCAYGEPSNADEPVGTAQQAQLDSGVRDYLVYAVWQGGTQIGQVLVTGTAGGGYVAQREYWYLTSNVSMSSAVTFTSATSEYWSSPPSGLGTLSFKMQRRPSWTSSTPRGTLLLETNPLTGERVGINWQMTETGGVWSGSIYWWHSTTGNLFGPSASDTLSPGTPATGTWYEYTTTPL